MNKRTVASGELRPSEKMALGMVVAIGVVIALAGVWWTYPSARPYYPIGVLVLIGCVLVAGLVALSKRPRRAKAPPRLTKTHPSGLFGELVSRCGGDRDVAERLLDHERGLFHGISREDAIEKAFRRLEYDRWR